MNQTREKGITLIALVITIIVLLILAGVTINMVLGDEGIISNAQKAKEDYTQKAKDTTDDLILLSLRTKYLDGKQDLDETEINTIVKSIDPEAYAEKVGENINVKKGETLLYTINKKGQKVSAGEDNGGNDEPTANEITFTIGNNEYKAKEGMTWEEWIFSDCNTVFDNTRYIRRTDSDVNDNTGGFAFISKDGTQYHVVVASGGGATPDEKGLQDPNCPVGWMDDEGTEIYCCGLCGTTTISGPYSYSRLDSYDMPYSSSNYTIVTKQ